MEGLVETAAGAGAEEVGVGVATRAADFTCAGGVSVLTVAGVAEAAGAVAGAAAGGGVFCPPACSAGPACGCGYWPGRHW